VKRARDIFFDLRLRAALRGYHLTFTGLAVEDGVHDSPRAYGRYYSKTKMVVIAPELLKKSDATIRGVLAHELGHAAVDAGLFSKGRSYDAQERAADRAAKKMFSLTIYYGLDNVQRAGKGARGTTPRPLGLR